LTALASNENFLLYRTAKEARRCCKEKGNKVEETKSRKSRMCSLKPEYRPYYSIFICLACDNSPYLSPMLK
jgi:hypothetical protein